MNIYDENDVKKHIKKDLAALGAAAPVYGGGENIRTLLAYLNRYCGEYLRALQQKGVIVSFRFGISPVFFWQPQLRVVLKTGRKADFALNGLYKLKPLFLRGS